MTPPHDLAQAQRELADPATTPQRLAQIAQAFPQLGAAVAAHPSAYPELRQWLSQSSPEVPPAPTQAYSLPSYPAATIHSSASPYPPPTQQPVQQPVQPPGPSDPGGNGRSYTGVIIAIIAVVVVIALAAALIAWLARGRGGDQADPTATAPSAGQPSSAAPSQDSDALVGTWTGTITQTGASAGSYEVTLVLQATEDGYTGTVDYPSIGCSGTWNEVSRESDTYAFLESIEAGSCVAEVPVSLTWVDESTAEYAFSDVQGSDGTGTLTRESDG